MIPGILRPVPVRRLWPLLAGVWLAAACGANPTVRIETADDLTAELRQAGASVAETAVLPYPSLGVPAWTWQLNQSLVTVYEFGSQHERQQAVGRFSRDGLALDGLPLMWSDRPTLWTVGRLIVLYVGTDGGTVLLLDGLLGDPANAPPPVLDEPYPPSIAAAIATLAERTNLDPGTIGVISFEEVEWPDACLEIDLPEQDCAQAVTPGWRVLLRAGDQPYEVHTDSLGSIVRIK